MTDAKYFTTTKKGEIFELKSELNSEKKEKKREAVKKVIFYWKEKLASGKSVLCMVEFNQNLFHTDLVRSLVSDVLGYCFYDSWEGRLCSLSRRC